MECVVDSKQMESYLSAWNIHDLNKLYQIGDVHCN